MTSDLAQALEGAPLSSRDDAFLATHFLAGAHETQEISARIAELQARLEEAKGACDSIVDLLRRRHPKGANLAAHGSLIVVPRSRKAPVAIEPLTTLA